MYGVPRASSAVCTTVAALPEIVAGGSGGGRSGGAPFPLAPLPPALLPSPNDTPSVALTPSRAPGRGRPTEPRANAELVDVGAIAIVPAPEMQLQRAAPSLRPERRREDEERREPPGPSQPRQRRAAPPTCVVPCDGTRGGGPGA